MRVSYGPERAADEEEREEIVEQAEATSPGTGHRRMRAGSPVNDAQSLEQRRLRVRPIASASQPSRQDAQPKTSTHPQARPRPGVQTRSQSRSRPPAPDPAFTAAEHEVLRADRQHREQMFRTAWTQHQTEQLEDAIPIIQGMNRLRREGGTIFGPQSRIGLIGSSLISLMQRSTLHNETLVHTAEHLDTHEEDLSSLRTRVSNIEARQGDLEKRWEEESHQWTPRTGARQVRFDTADHSHGGGSASFFDEGFGDGGEGDGRFRDV